MGPRIIRLAMLAALAVLASPLGAQTPVHAFLPGHASLPGHVIGALADATRLPHTRQMDEEPITVTVPTHTSCTMLTPAHAAGMVNVRAVAPWGFTSPVLPIDDQFTYY